MRNKYVLTDSEFDKKLAAFMALLESDMENANIERGSILHDSAVKKGRRGYHQIEADASHKGQRFVRVCDQGETQRFVKFFVEKETGIIFGAKGYKAYNPNHQYGTLDTIAEWNWAPYYPEAKDGITSSLVPAEARR